MKVTNNIKDDLDGIPRIHSIEVASTSHHYIVLSLLHNWLINIALPKAVGVLLDFGCGGQPYKKLFAPTIMQYIGADVATAQDVELDIILIPGQPVPLADATINTILSTQTIEHVFDIDFYIHECERLLAPGGTLILTAPMQWRIHEAPYDYWRFTRYGLNSLFVRHNLIVDSITPCGGVSALLGQIFTSHLAESGFSKPWILRTVNKFSLWLDKKIPDTEDTLLWMCLVKKQDRSHVA